MYKKLGRIIIVVNTIAITFIILVGGVSVYLASGILHNEYKIKEMSEHINVVNSLHNDSLRFLLFLHDFCMAPDENIIKDAVNLLGKIEGNLNDYIAIEEAEEYHETIEDLYAVRNDLQHLKGVKLVFNDYLATGDFDSEALHRYEGFGRTIEKRAMSINRVHFNNIKQWRGESLSNMWIIFYFYILFVFFGGISIYIGNRLVSKHIILPIKTLADATNEFASGKLNKRVYTDSHTEIGFLYRSFNKMAEKLQENDDFLRKFNEELEKKVGLRTTELKKANEKLRRTQAALVRTEKIAAVGQVSAGVTHEIKNPLNSLAINAQMLMKQITRKLGGDSSEYQSAALIQNEITRINNILEEFVKFARFPEPQFFENDMNLVIKEVVDLMSSGLKDLDINIRLGLDDSILPFAFDARQFKEVLVNLIQNAVNAIGEKGVIEVTTELVEGKQVIITITDTGEGIKEKELTEIFDPFYSTRADGMGLGLPIVQRIVENHNGSITCSSKVGIGTTFAITLPLLWRKEI